MKYLNPQHVGRKQEAGKEPVTRPIEMRAEKMTFRMAGSCGEWVQGLVDRREVLISYPVNLYNQLTIGRVQSVDLQEGVQWQELPEKMQRGIGLTIDHLGVAQACVDELVWAHRREIPVGMGMGSSTVDLALACGGLAYLLGMAMSEQELARILVQVEPTDSILFSQATLFEQNRGSYIETVSPYPRMGVVALGLDEQMDTLDFREQRQVVPAVGLASQWVLYGLEIGMLPLVGMGATKSAQAWQDILPKPRLQELIELAQVLGCYGINVAHSGTVVGILYDPEKMTFELIAERLRQSGIREDYPLIWDLSMVDGGLQVWQDNEFVPIGKGEV